MSKNIISSIKTILSDNIIALLFRICSAIENMFTYFNKKTDIKQQKTIDKKTAKINKKIEDACDNGDISDLFDAVKNKKIIKSVLIILFVFISGCTTIEISATKQWEGRYLNSSDAVNAIKNVKLDNNESIWILSNKTLKRLLIKDTEN